MKHNKIEFRPIGLIHTPWSGQGKTPRSTNQAAGAEGTVELLGQFADGAKDLEGFERIWLIWHTDRCRSGSLVVQPPFDTPPKGVFATRSPSRPNCIALSCVRLTDVDVDSGLLSVLDVDMLDGSPLLDIKPYSPGTDCFPGCRCGWFDSAIG